MAMGGTEASYTIPDAYSFTQGSYVLMVSASVVSAGDPQRAHGHREEPQLAAGGYLCERDDEGCRLPGLGRQSSSVPQRHVRLRRPDPAAELSLLLRSESGVDRQAPVRRVVFSSGAGTAAQVALPGFTDPVANAAVLGVAKSNSSTITQELANEIADIGTGAEQHRLSAAWELGEETTPSASWSDSSNWISVGLEISAGTSGPTPTTTTTVGPTTTTLGTGGLDGWIGCSMTAQTLMATGPLEAQQFYGGREYPVGGATSSVVLVELALVDRVPPTGGALGEPDRLVVMVCS